MRSRTPLRLFVALSAVALFAVACGGGGDGDEPLEPAEAASRLEDLADEVECASNPVTRSASIPPPQDAELADVLPPITEFPIVVDAPSGAGEVVEIFVSSEKSGEDTDGWMVEVAEAFNRDEVTLADGTQAAVEVRRIASGVGYQFIASGHDLPGGYSPSNQLWVEMAGTHEAMTPIREQTVPNIAGIVMKTETAEALRAGGGELDAAALIESVISGEVVMGYTDPFVSSTGLNFLLTVLDDFAEGDESRLTSPDVASVFEQFQRQVPFVALTTLQIRESVESDTGTLDAFVMEYQTFVKTDSLSSGFEFIPFGVRHDNPLYGVGDLTSAQLEVLEAFAAFSERSEFREKAAEFGFEPPAYESDVAIPSGSTLIDVQQVWKDKKDGGRQVATVFVIDTSGSMEGTRIQALRKAMLSSREFIKPETKVGVVEFNTRAATRLAIEEFDLNQQARFAALAEDLSPTGGTAMYDGIVCGLTMLQAETAANPDVKPILVVLTDGETRDGLDFGEVDETIQGLRVPVYTVGFEADLDELGRLSSLVEAANIDANEADVEYRIAALFNAGG